KGDGGPRDLKYICLLWNTFNSSRICASPISLRMTSRTILFYITQPKIDPGKGHIHWQVDLESKNSQHPGKHNKYFIIGNKYNRKHSGQEYNLSSESVMSPMCLCHI